MKCEFEKLTLFPQNEEEAVLKCLQDDHMDILTKQNENLIKCSHCVSTQKYPPKEDRRQGWIVRTGSMTYFCGRHKLRSDIFIIGIQT